MEFRQTMKDIGLYSADKKAVDKHSATDCDGLYNILDTDGSDNLDLSEVTAGRASPLGLAHLSNAPRTSSFPLSSSPLT